jgi:L-ascorbate metabolism protein UlaG (beta-lactamase superfamily)
MSVHKKTILLAMLVAVTTVTGTACSSNPHYDRNKAHHTPDGFRNLYIDDSAKGFSAFAKWKWQQLFMDRPDSDAYDFPVDKTRHAAIRQNESRPSLTWIGHATFLIQFKGINILTDPQFSDRASPVSFAGPQRVTPPAMTVDELPEIDAVVISHDHYDSLDVASIEALAVHNKNRTLHFFVPLGFGAWFGKLDLKNIKLVELDWGQGHRLGPLTFTAEPVQHWGKRTLFDAFERLWASWVIEADNKRIFFAGDSGYVRHFRETGEKYGRFDLALIPIGAYAPRWFMQSYHVNPTEAVKVHQDLRSRYSVAMHWGTFILTDEPLDEPPVKLADALGKAGVTSAEFEVYRHGESRFLDQLLDETRAPGGG